MLGFEVKVMPETQANDVFQVREGRTVCPGENMLCLKNDLPILTDPSTFARFRMFSEDAAIVPKDYVGTKKRLDVSLRDRYWRVTNPLHRDRNF